MEEEEEEVCYVVGGGGPEAAGGGVHTLWFSFDRSFLRSLRLST